MPNHSDTQGGFLGLRSTKPSMAMVSSFVAVEFDTFANTWDPNFVHVGININSINSNALTRWDHPISEGITAEAWISYDSRASLLSVNFTNFKDGETHEFGYISVPVNLSQVLPEWVVVGFTATTGNYTELHKILSWEFSTNAV
ncbi:hypothetical protein NL676_015922 [Syzygium grande]|nr:hypothetical protein NL676_015922 [Syzygium grande]